MAINPRTARNAAPAARTAAKPATRTASKADAPEKVGLQKIRDLITEGMPLVSRATVEKVLLKTFEVITDEFSKGNIVNIKDFGKFFLQDRAARTGRNPQTGAAIKIPAKRVAKFSYAKKLKEMAL